MEHQLTIIFSPLHTLVQSMNCEQIISIILLLKIIGLLGDVAHKLIFNVKIVTKHILHLISISQNNFHCKNFALFWLYQENSMNLDAKFKINNN
jgi:hypothetical protein